MIPPINATVPPDILRWEADTDRISKTLGMHREAVFVGPKDYVAVTPEALAAQDRLAKKIRTLRASMDFKLIAEFAGDLYIVPVKPRPYQIEGPLSARMTTEALRHVAAKHGELHLIETYCWTQQGYHGVSVKYRVHTPIQITTH